MPNPVPDQSARRQRPLSSRQLACLKVVAEGALYIKDGSVMRTVESLGARGLLALDMRHGHYGWHLTDAGRAVLDENNASKEDA